MSSDNNNEKDSSGNNSDLIAKLLRSAGEELGDQNQHTEAQKVITDLLKETRKEIQTVSEKATAIELKQQQACDYMHRLHEDHSRLEKRVTSVEKDLIVESSNLSKHIIESTADRRIIGDALTRLQTGQEKAVAELSDHRNDEERDRKEMIRHLQENNTRITWGGFGVAASVVVAMFVLLWQTGVLSS